MNTCRYFTCDSEVDATYLDDPAAKWELCGARRILVRNALGPEVYRYRVESVPLYAGRIQIVPKQPSDPMPGAPKLD
jgi:hypothetical protein